jgi:hypothetical protein
MSSESAGGEGRTGNGGWCVEKISEELSLLSPCQLTEKANLFIPRDSIRGTFTDGTARMGRK